MVSSPWRTACGHLLVWNPIQVVKTSQLLSIIVEVCRPIDQRRNIPQTSGQGRQRTTGKSQKDHFGTIKSVHSGKGLSMVSRIWHGYTTEANADAYERLLKEEIFVGINNRHIQGYCGIHLLRRNVGNTVEFITIMWFETIEAVRQFAGDDYEKAVVPDRARTLLSHFDERSQHYDVKVDRTN
jgi:hypothetical protein